MDFVNAADECTINKIYKEVELELTITYPPVNATFLLNLKKQLLNIQLPSGVDTKYFDLNVDSSISAADLVIAKKIILGLVPPEHVYPE